MNSVPIPSTTSDITSHWIQLVTGHLPISNSLQIQSDIQEGYGFLSSILRVTYKIPGNPPESRSIIVKLLPTSSRFDKYALCQNADEREVHAYNIIHPDIFQAVPSLRENLCKFYYGSYQPANLVKNLPHQSLLVMEDLKALNFEMMAFSGNGSPQVLTSLITFMARLHYAGHVVSLAKGKPLPVLYPFLQGITEDTQWINQMDEVKNRTFSQLEKLLKTQNIPDNIWKRYQKLKPFTKEIYSKVDQAGRQMPCLIHGDVWCSNIMLHTSLPVKILDWQFVAYRDPTYDLSFMLQTVLPPEQFSKENMRKWAKEYWTAFELLCEQGQYNDKIKRRKWPEFEKFFFTWASAFGFLIDLPEIESMEKDFPKYANIAMVLCEEIGLAEFLLGICEIGENCDVD